jgi:hypothetical protein
MFRVARKSSHGRARWTKEGPRSSHARCYGTQVARSQPSVKHETPPCRIKAKTPSPLLSDPISKLDEILRRIQGEFLEMPGLRLTDAQACRLWGLDTATCAALLDALVTAKFLFRTRDGAVMRIEHAAPVKAKLSPRAAGLTAA